MTPVVGMITTTLTPNIKKDVIGVAVYNPDDGTIWLDCCQDRDWEQTKDFTGITDGVYNRSLRSETVFKEVLERLSSRVIATFSHNICKDCFRAYGYNNDCIISIPSAMMVARSSFIPWDRFEENDNIAEWVQLLNKNKIKISRQDLATYAKAERCDKRLYGIKCLDNLELDGAIWDAVLNTPC